MSLVQAVVDRIKNLTLPSEIPVSLELVTPLSEDEALTLIELTGEEKLNDCFSFDLTCVAPKFTIDFQKLIGKEVSIIFRYGDKDAQLRYIHGIVGEVRQGPTNVDDLDRKAITKPKTFNITQVINGEKVTKEVTVPAPETTIYLKVYPALWTTKFTKNCKIFQEKTTLDIIKEVLDEHKIIKNIKYDNTDCGETEREYCVQYNESDFEFITRLMAEDGLFFYHTHTKEEHTLVIADAPATHEELEDPQKIQTQQFRPKTPLPNHIQAIEVCEQTVVENLAITDYNFETPSTNLFTLEGEDTPVSRVYHYPGRFMEEAGGTENAKHGLEYYSWQKNLVQGRSTIFGFQAGKAFTLADHIREDANKKYVLHTVKHEMTIDPKKGKFVYQNAFIAFDYDTPFRPEPFKEKPRIPSTQTAVVTGQDGEEIWTDEYGRIKVQFHWDQDGEKNEQTTCWLRVQQVWAGNNWGFIFVPRIGMEVVVSFINGDPDRPLVTGCVYNQENMPPSVGEDPKWSTIRTQSTKDDTDGRFHELTFDDTLNTERIYLHSSHDFNIDVQHERTADIHDSHDLVTLHAEEGNDANQVITLKQGNRVITLNKGSHLHTLLQGDMMQLLMQGNKSEILSQGNKLVALAAGNEMHTIGGNFGLACAQMAIACGGISLSASSSGGGGGSVEVSESESDGGEEDSRNDGSALPTITEPDNPADEADDSKVATNIDTLDVETTITNGNMTLEISGGDRETTISGDDTLEVGGNVTQTISGDYELEVTGDFKLTVTGDITISAANITIKSDMATTVEAGTSLDLTASTTWTAAGLSIDMAADTTLNAAGSAQATVDGGGALTLSGGAVQIN